MSAELPPTTCVLQHTVSGMAVLHVTEVQLYRDHRGAWGMILDTVADGATHAVTVRIGQRRDLDRLLAAVTRAQSAAP
jgi:hypothetical protein